MANERTQSLILVGFGAAPAIGDVVNTTNNVIVNPKIGSKRESNVGSGVVANSEGYTDSSDITAQISIETFVLSPVSLGAACELSKLLKICGLAETLTVGTSAVYKLGGTYTQGTGQVKVHSEYGSRTMTDASATLKITGKIGEKIKASITVDGVLSSTAATAGAKPAAVFNAGSPIVMTKANTTVVVAGTTLAVIDFELDIKGTVNRSYTSNTNYFYIKNYEPQLSLNFIKTLTTDENAWTQLAVGGKSVISITVGAANNQMVIDAPAAFSDSVEEADASMKKTMKRVFALENGGTDYANFTITFK